MPTAAPTDVPSLPVPTGDALMAVVAEGPAACARWRETFVSWDPRAAVPQIVMNALDPALLELVLGPGNRDPLVRLLRAHYADVRERFPGPFADVEKVWRIQRAWWMQFVEADDAEATSAALAETFATLDVLEPHPAGALWLRGQRPPSRLRPRRPPSRRAPAAPAPVKVRPSKLVRFAYAWPALRQRKLIPFARRWPALRTAVRRRRSRAHTRRHGRAERNLQTHAVSPTLAARLAAAQERTGYSTGTIAAGALRIGLTGHVARLGAPPSRRSNRGATIKIRVSEDLYGRVHGAAKTTGHSVSAIVAGAIAAGLARWLRRQGSASSAS